MDKSYDTSCLPPPVEQALMGLIEAVVQAWAPAAGETTNDQRVVPEPRVYLSQVFYRCCPGGNQ